MEVVVGGLLAIAGGVVATLVAEHREDRRLRRQKRDATRVLVVDVTRQLLNAADAFVDTATWTSVTQRFEAGGNEAMILAWRQFTAAVTDVRLLGMTGLDELAGHLLWAVRAVFELAVRDAKASTDEMSEATAVVDVAKTAFLRAVRELVGGVEVE